jgi:hypothetical protein
MDFNGLNGFFVVLPKLPSNPPFYGGPEGRFEFVDSGIPHLIHRPTLPAELPNKTNLALPLGGTTNNPFNPVKIRSICG